MNIPYLLIKNNDTLIANTRRLILYNKTPKIKATGIVDENLNGWHVGHLNDTIYTIDLEKSAMDRRNFILYKYTFNKKSEEVGFYKTNNSFELNNKFGDYTAYIKEMRPSLTNLDTIALLPTYSACGTCVDLLGSFLNSIQTNNFTSKPFIMVNSNVFQGENFLKDFNFTLQDYIVQDSSSKMLNYMAHPNSFGFFIKDTYGYRFEKIKYDDLEYLFKYLNPNVKIIQGICVPKKDY
jgi:hypothetical protein